ncbi:MAG: hypothetical protein FD167_2438 [bacterium]|nr:MAG: hypothetical protein FD167_2438 [bacterium]
MKKTLEQIQAEFHQDAEALVTLQGIYAERIKQIRTNRAFPPDIQQRFLLEWEQFYDQRIKEIFSYASSYTSNTPSNESNSGDNFSAMGVNNSSNSSSEEQANKRSKR